MKFKIDENLPAEAARALVNAGHDALTILDQQMGGKPDSQVAKVCQSEQRVVLTLDFDFADIRTYPPVEYFGIIVLSPRTQSKPAVCSLIDQLIPLLDKEPLIGHLWIVQETGLRIREG